ncbi:MAG TPA: hypothetical protein VNF06_02510, partial [Candidatus Aquilonibacter sp.]|nr:hypothetical protein [Candidatus Aquilonibacter sp.]
IIMSQSGVKTKGQEIEAVNATIEGLLRKSGENSEEARNIRENLNMATTYERDAEGFVRDRLFGRAAYTMSNAAGIYKLIGMNESAKGAFFASAQLRAQAVIDARLREMNQRMDPEGISSYILENRDNLPKVQEINNQARQLVEALVDSGVLIKSLTDEMKEALVKAHVLSSGIALHYISEEDVRKRQHGLHSSMFGEDAARYLFYYSLAQKGEKDAFDSVHKYNDWLVGKYDEAIGKMDSVRNGFIENSEKILSDLLEVAARQ